MKQNLTIFFFPIVPSATDLNFDTKPSPSGQNENIFSQPRASSTSPHQQYGFSTSTSGSSVKYADQVQKPSVIESNSVRTTHRNSNASSGTTTATTSPTSPASPTSPVISVRSSSNSSSSSSSSAANTPATGSKSHSRRSSQTQEGWQPSHRNDELPSVHEHLPKSRVDKLKPKRFIDHIELTNSECDCSDDETISKFTNEYMKTSPSNDTAIRQTADNEPEPGPSGSSSNGPSGIDLKSKGDSSNTSSFEELGGASGTSNGDWLFVTKPSDDVVELPADVAMNTDCTQPPNNEDSNASSNINLTHLTFQNAAAHSSQQNISPGTSIDRVRRLVRRRSDGSIYNSSGAKLYTDSMEEATVPDDVSEDETLRKRTKTSSCDKCGKSKRSLKRHVAKFKRQLETTNASEIEIKKQLEAFLEYLETCQKGSMDGTDTESNDGDAGAGGENPVTNENVTLGADFVRLNDNDDNYDFEYDEGIHVYGTDHDETKGTPRQFVDINDYENR